ARRPQHPELIRVQPERNDHILPGQHTAPQRQPQPHALPLEQRVHHTLPGLYLNSEFKNTGTKEKAQHGNLAKEVMQLWKKLQEEMLQRGPQREETQSTLQEVDNTSLALLDLEHKHGQTGVHVSKPELTAALCDMWQENESVAAKNLWEVEEWYKSKFAISVRLLIELKQLCPVAGAAGAKRVPKPGSVSYLAKSILDSLLLVDSHSKRTILIKKVKTRDRFSMKLHSITHKIDLEEK
ncbi:hypothetical protein E2I00_003739, partial [Balaenoptera physalus]